MRFGRTAWGIVAGIVSMASVGVVYALEMRYRGSPNRYSLWSSFIGSGGAVLWVAEHFGLMAAPYTEPVLGLRSQTQTDRRVGGRE